MTLKELSNEEILKSTERHVAQERAETLLVLELLRENERRRLFAKLGYSSLFTYMVEHLKYSEGAAFRRIKAMWLSTQCPEAREAIAAGRMNLTTASQVQVLFEKKQMDQEEKREILKKVEGASKAEVERVVADYLPKERKISLEVDEELVQKLEELKKLLPHQDTNDLLHKLADQMLTKLRASPEKSREVGTRSPGASLKRLIWTKASGQCEYMKDGRRCTERTHLQFDHIQPYALGGPTSPENLRLLCRAHNQAAAIRTFGVAKLREYVPSLRD